MSALQQFTFLRLDGGLGSSGRLQTGQHLINLGCCRHERLPLLQLEVDACTRERPR